MSARSEAPTSFRSSSVRPGPVELIRIGINDVLSRRRLIAWLVRTDIKKKGADTFLGNLWWVLDPLLQMMVYYLLITVILSRRTPDFPLFVFSAILPWKWFSSSVQDGLTSVSNMERLIKQINFPKLVLPFSAVLAGIVNFAFGMIPLFGMLLLVYPAHLSAWPVLIPVVAVVQLIFSLALSTLLSAVNVFYRDVGNLARHVLRFWWYLSPGLYGADVIDQISAQYPAVGQLMHLNPFQILFTSYRNLIYYGKPPEWLPLAILGLASTLFLVFSIYLFKRIEPTFAKVL